MFIEQGRYLQHSHQQGKTWCMFAIEYQQVCMLCPWWGFQNKITIKNEMIQMQWTKQLNGDSCPWRMKSRVKFRCRCPDNDLFGKLMFTFLLPLEPMCKLCTLIPLSPVCHFIWGGKEFHRRATLRRDPATGQRPSPRPGIWQFCFGLLVIVQELSVLFKICDITCEAKPIETLENKLPGRRT